MERNDALHYAERWGLPVCVRNFWRLMNSYSRRHSSILFCFILWSALAGASPALATTRVAASCDQKDVQAAIDTAFAGDTILIPTGSCVWSSRLSITKYLIVKAAETRKTIITDNSPNLSNLIEILEDAAGNTRLVGLTFVQGTAVHLNPNGVIKLQGSQGGKPVVISENEYRGASQSGDFIIVHSNRGVITGNSMTGQLGGGICGNNASFVRHKPHDGSWAGPAKYGAADTTGDFNLYLEDNTLTNVFEGVDVDDDGRNVTRHNKFINSGFLHHGADTGAIGARHSDVYKNEFIWDPTVRCGVDLPAGVNSFLYVRGGTVLIHENIFADVRGQAWGDKSEITFNYEPIRRNAGDYPCWAGGYPAPHQPGWGFTTGATKAGNLLQDLEPTYIWGNTGAGNHNNPSVQNYDPNECGTAAAASTATNFIRLGREYIMGPQPGYAEYTYPHPLSGNTVAPTQANTPAQSVIPDPADNTAPTAAVPETVPVPLLPLPAPAPPDPAPLPLSDRAFNQAPPKTIKTLTHELGFA